MGCDIFQYVTPTLDCCFCCTSKTGARIVGTIQACFGGFMLLGSVMKTLSDFPKLSVDWTPIVKMTITGLCAIFLSILLLKGVNQDRLKRIKYWLFIQLILMLVWFVFQSVIFFSENEYEYNIEVQLIFHAFTYGYTVYLILVVSSYYSMKIRQTDQSPVPYNRATTI